MFTYYLENQNGRISKTSLENNIAISIKCGNFSYAEIPKPPQFEYIMGITGTLKTLTEPEKEVIISNTKFQKILIYHLFLARII